MQWDDNEFPIAYLLTFRTYGTWHHGDERGSVDRKYFNHYGKEGLKPVPGQVEQERGLQKSPSLEFDDKQREEVRSAIREVCGHRGYSLQAVNVRTNHVHAVVAARAKPEKIAEAFKGYSTRRLRALGLAGRDAKIWSRHCSTKYLWKAHQVAGAVEYVHYNQGNDFLIVTDIPVE